MKSFPSKHDGTCWMLKQTWKKFQTQVSHKMVDVQNTKMEKGINMEDFFLTIFFFIIQIIRMGNTYHDRVSIVINALLIPNEYETFVCVTINILTRQILLMFNKLSSKFIHHANLWELKGGKKSKDKAILVKFKKVMSDKYYRKEKPNYNKTFHMWLGKFTFVKLMAIGFEIAWRNLRMVTRES
jgi:hypothetical protein